MNVNTIVSDQLFFFLSSFFIRVDLEIFLDGFGNVTNKTLHAEDQYIKEITPSYWVYRCLNALNYCWQLAWLLYSLTFIYRRSSTGYLYLSPNTLTPTFYIIYTVGFVIQSIWLVFFQRSYFAVR